MNGLQFQNLPKSPENKIKRDFSQIESRLKKNFDLDMAQLRRTPLTDDDFAMKSNELTARHKKLLSEQQSKMNDRLRQLSMVKELSDGGFISPDKVQELGWKMVLPKDVSSAMYPTAQARAPFSPGRIADYAELAQRYSAPKIVETRGFEWGPPKVKKDKLLGQYTKFQQDIGYAAMAPNQRNQVDFIWDEQMKTKKHYGWDPTDVEVKKLRPRGRLTQAASNKFMSPMDKSIRKSVITVSKDKYGNPLFIGRREGTTPRAKEPTAIPEPQMVGKVMVIKDGKKFRLPKSQLDAALAQGYKRAD